MVYEHSHFPQLKDSRGGADRPSSFLRYQDGHPISCNNSESWIQDPNILEVWNIRMNSNLPLADLSNSLLVTPR